MPGKGAPHHAEPSPDAGDGREPFDGAAGGPEEARRRGVEGLFIAVVAFLTGLVGSGVAAGVWVAAAGLDGGQRTLGLVVAELGGLWVGLIGVPLMAGRVRGRGSPLADLRLFVRWVDVPLGVVAGLASAYLVAGLYTPFFHRYPRLREQFEKPAKEVIGVAHGRGLVLLAVVLVAAVPLVEECYFRGVVFRSLDRLMAVPSAVVVSGLVFGLAHGQLLQLPALALFGCVLAVLAHRTGRLGPALFAHATFNAVAMAQSLTKLH